MFLLILERGCDMLLKSWFTFHYVSTYTKKLKRQRKLMTNLHSTMFLLIPKPSAFNCFACVIYIPLCFYLYENCLRSLRPLLSIYIPLCFYLYLRPYNRAEWRRSYLHSTMFLLIRKKAKRSINSYTDLHSTMFLLIRGKRRKSGRSETFTFHYVSTYTSFHVKIVA